MFLLPAAPRCMALLEHMRLFDAKLHTDDALAYRGMPFDHQTVKHSVGECVNEFAGRHNIRNDNTLDQMHHVVAGLVGKRLMYRDLIAFRESRFTRSK